MAFKLNPNSASFVPKFTTKPAVVAEEKKEEEEVKEVEVVSPPTNTTTTTTTTTTTSSTSSTNITSPEYITTESVYTVDEDDIEDDEDDEEIGDVTNGVKKTAIKELPEDSREHVNIVFLGHVDAGKSTISGNIMLLTGQVDAHTLAKYEREAKENHRESWIFAYIMDTNEEERAKGKTVEVGRAHFETEKKRFTILDAPGHRNYVPNMIIGAAQADIAILVISSKKGEFEAGVDGGQTIEHARLAKMIGIKQLLVLVNKMDEPSVAWSKVRYDEIVEKMTTHLKKCGYNPKKDFSFIPGSGYTSANIKDPLKPGVCDWYSGPSLMGTLDELPPIERNLTHALRVPLSSSYRERGMLHAIGKIESGTISVGQPVYIMPQKIKTEVIALTGDVCSFRTAQPGENITIVLKAPEEETIKQGSVISEIPRPVPCVSEIEATVIILDLPLERRLFTADFEAIFHAHSAVEEVKVKKLISLVDMKTGVETKKDPPFAKVGEQVKCRLLLNKPVCLEEFSMNPQLARFTLRESGKTIAFGKVTSIGKKAKEAYLASVAAAGK